MAQGSNLFTGNLFTRKDAGVDQVKDCPGCKHPARRYAQNRNVFDVRDHEHRPGQNGGAVYHIPGTRFFQSESCSVIRINGHATGCNDNIGAFFDQLSGALGNLLIVIGKKTDFQHFTT